MKDVGFRIRVQRELREQFLEACRMQDKPAAQVLREFMREYVARQTSAAGGPGMPEQHSLQNPDNVEPGRTKP